MSQRWPVRIAPESDELLSSWLLRLGFANGLAPRDFGRVLGFHPGKWPRRLDLNVPEVLGEMLRARAGLSSSDLTRLCLPEGSQRALLLPLRCDLPSGRQAKFMAAWLQFCPRCLAEDGQPYFRRTWRSATAVICLKHQCRLLDRCEDCGQAIGAFNHLILRPQHICATCSRDLRRSCAPRLEPVASRAAIKLLYLGQAASSREGLAGSLLRLPRRLMEPRHRSLAQLSSVERARGLTELSGAIDKLFQRSQSCASPLPQSARPRPLRGAELDDLFRAYSATRREASSLKS
ncbi:TniQ family protein [Microvirga sp. TS319]|uniref:TniQ family protein n=1 Tax=Microvirga sp. TS319 TaxID=3241165 RepID=UPI003519E009